MSNTPSSTPDYADQPLEILFKSALSNIGKLENNQFSPLSVEYKQLHARTLDVLGLCLQKIDRLALFSPNEELDDVTTRDLRYLNLEYYIAYVMEKTTVDPSSVAVSQRINAVKTSVRKYIDFLMSLKSYGLELSLVKAVPVNLDSLLPNGKQGLFDLNGLRTQLDPSVHREAARDAKIETFRATKSARERLDLAIRRLSSPDSDSLNEDRVREMEIARLNLHMLMAWESIRGACSELDLLRRMIAEFDKDQADNVLNEDPVPYLPSAFISTETLARAMGNNRSVRADGDNHDSLESQESTESKHPGSRSSTHRGNGTAPAGDITNLAWEMEQNANRITLGDLGDESRKANEQKELSTKVEIGPIGSTSDHLRKAKSLLGPNGQIKQPFTITDGRQKISRDVFGTGQKLPTMTIEEILQKELANQLPRDLQRPKNSSDDEDSDRDSVVDAATEKARRWDEFTEHNPRGSGNTMNIG